MDNGFKYHTTAASTFRVVAWCSVIKPELTLWIAGVLPAGLLSLYWLIRFRQLKIEPF
jgi:hypothetical protein